MNRAPGRHRPEARADDDGIDPVAAVRINHRLQDRVALRQIARDDEAAYRLQPEVPGYRSPWWDIRV